MKAIYKEVQTQRRLVPWFLVAGIWGIAILKIMSAGLSVEYILFEIVVLFVLPLIFTLLLFFLKLTIIVSDSEIRYQHFPVQIKFQSISFSTIQTAELKKYNRDRRFCGWGLGISFSRKAKSYTVSGYEGIKIRLTDGTQIFLGTKHPEEIKKIIDNYKCRTDSSL